MTVLQVQNLTKRYSVPGDYFGRGGETITALDDVSFEVRRGETVGIVGESGSGKSTLSRIILGLEQPDAGRIVFDGVDLATLSRRELRAIRARIQVVFQDPYASLNPRMSVHDLIAEPMEVHRDTMGISRGAITDRVAELLTLVQMQEDHMHRYPHEFSGGQRQRIGIARALACKPELIVLDEPTSALDVSVQAQVLELLIGLQDELGLTYLFISHDLAVVRYLCESALLVRKGRLVESAPIEQLFTAPQSDYARMLIGAMPDIDPDKSPYRT
ncbi:MAG: ATP-binding cassette domain-containing protein [Roseitalea porphyridii]|jgi:ABC-type glutathione transport system ATPase component|uniref:ATP-binding cassette domain-containing protein n=1 Tax=Roseitalea porphyridii TaxID=1852022 RepID=UPI0032F08A67